MGSHFYKGELNKGELKRWNEDRGFGFISPENGGNDVFIHISSLKGMSRRPVVGDVIHYQLRTDNRGRNQAINAKIEGVILIKPSSNGKMLKLINFLLVMALFIGLIFYKDRLVVFYKDFSEKPYSTDDTSYLTPTLREQENKQNYSCDGKIHCSEMTSCDEAMFYQKNCHGTKMDGDRDGIPCENQLCGRW